MIATREDIGTAVGAVENVDGALAGISGSVEQVLSLVSGMAEETAMIDQTSAAARNLATEADGLSRNASRFKTGDAVVMRMAARVRPRSTGADRPEHLIN